MKSFKLTLSEDIAHYLYAFFNHPVKTWQSDTYRELRDQIVRQYEEHRKRAEKKE